MSGFGHLADVGDLPKDRLAPEAAVRQSNVMEHADQLISLV
jgi:hypothetical protein